MARDPDGALLLPLEKQNAPIMPDILFQKSVVGFRRRTTGRALYRIDPLGDPRWVDLLKRHPGASLFHSIAWLEALRRTYDYEPIVYTTSEPLEPLDNGIPFCGVDSWLTGNRLVSLPFSDYCTPLVESGEDLQFFLTALEEESRKKGWRYVEMRPPESFEVTGPRIHPIAAYVLHQLDLRPDLGTLFANFHKTSIQRKIRRAERGNLTYQEGSTESILDVFYRLLVLTRRRHGVPPQPRKWFRGLMDCFGEALKIRVAYKGGCPVAGMLTIRYKDALVYKYGGSDARFNNLGGMHLLYWQAIQEAKNLGLRVFDLGRSDADQAGLITFKSRWGATQSKLTYSRLVPLGEAMHIFDPAVRTWRTRIAKRVFSNTPTRVLSALGTVLYKHIG